MKIENILYQFDNLKKSVVDASSIIYMNKAEFLSLLARNVSLITISEALDEINSRIVKIRIASSEGLYGTTDEKLVSCALQLNLPIISEDRKILRTASEKGMDYFNSLMMLNFLFYRQQASEQEYQRYLEKLRKIAWYGNEIWEFGVKLHEVLREREKE